MVASGSLGSFVLPACSALFALAGTASAGDVFVVSPSGPYTQIQPAIDAASDYDTILVKPFPTTSSTYNGFMLNGKSLAIVGDPTPGQPVKVRGEMGIQTLPAEGLALLASFAGECGAGYDPPQYALKTTDNLGAIRIQSCQLLGSYYTVCGSIGVDADTQIVASDLFGRDGVWRQQSGLASQAGNALITRALALRLFGCNVMGGDGGTQPNPDEDVGLIFGGDAGHALDASSGLVFAVGCSFQGGDGGNGSIAWCREHGGADGGLGGDGIRVGHSPAFGEHTQLYTLACTLQAGAGGTANLGSCPGTNGPPGMAVRVLASGDWQNFANGAARYLSGTPLARENANVALTARGLAGDRVYVRIEIVDPPQSFPFVGSHSPLGHTPKARFVFLGTIPPSGTLSTTIPTGPLAAGVQSIWWRLRSTFVVSSGAMAEGNDIVVAIVDSAL